MKAFIFERNGEPTEVLLLQDISNPSPGPGEVLVRVHLSPVHPTDLHVMRGRFGRQPTPPASPGVECVGVVEALGPGTSGPAIGTRVVLIGVWGCWRELVISPVEQVVLVPDNVSDEDAAQAMVNPLTAWILTMVEHKLQPGEWLIQTAAGSTVGRLVLQLARHKGFKTINIVRRRAQVAEIAELGGDAVLCTEDEDWSLQLARSGIALYKAIDCVAGRIGADLALALAPGGRLIIFGALSSHRQTERSAFEMPLFAPALVYKAATVQGWFLFHWLTVTPPQQSVDAMSGVLDHLSSGVLRLPKATQYSPSQIDLALQEAEGSSRNGKPLLNFTKMS